MKQLNNLFLNHPNATLWLTKGCFYLLMILGFFLASCATQKRCNEKFPAQISTTDSISVVEKTVYRDTIITIPGAAIHDTISVVIDCDKNGKGTIRPLIRTNQSGYVSQTVAIAGNKLVVNCKADSLKQVIERQKIQIEKNGRQTSQKTQVITACEIPAFYQFQNKVAIAAEIILLLAVGYGFYRFYKV